MPTNGVPVRYNTIRRLSREFHWTYMSVTVRSDSSSTCSATKKNHFLLALKALICMLGRCQVAHTAHYSFWTGKAASSRDGGEDDERYHPSCTHCKGSVDRIPGKRRRDIFAETNSIRFAGRPPRSMPLRLARTLFPVSRKAPSSCLARIVKLIN